MFCEVALACRVIELSAPSLGGDDSDLEGRPVGTGSSGPQILYSRPEAWTPAEPPRFNLCPKLMGARVSPSGYSASSDMRLDFIIIVPRHASRSGPVGLGHHHLTPAVRVDPKRHRVDGGNWVKFAGPTKIFILKK